MPSANKFNKNFPLIQEKLFLQPQKIKNSLSSLFCELLYHKLYSHKKEKKPQFVLLEHSRFFVLSLEF